MGLISRVSSRTYRKKNFSKISMDNGNGKNISNSFSTMCTRVRPCAIVQLIGIPADFGPHEIMNAVGVGPNEIGRIWIFDDGIFGNLCYISITCEMTFNVLTSG